MKVAAQSGQALLSLLVFMAVATTLTAGAVIVTIVNIQGTTSFNRGQTALYNAETGVDQAVLRLLRNPDYTGGELVIAPDSTAVVTITGSNPIIIRSEGRSGLHKRIIEANVTSIDGVLSVTNWSEVY